MAEVYSEIESKKKKLEKTSRDQIMWYLTDHVYCLNVTLSVMRSHWKGWKDESQWLGLLLDKKKKERTFDQEV